MMTNSIQIQILWTFQDPTRWARNAEAADQKKSKEHNIPNGKALKTTFKTNNAQKTRD